MQTKWQVVCIPGRDEDEPSWFLVRGRECLTMADQGEAYATASQLNAG